MERLLLPQPPESEHSEEVSCFGGRARLLFICQQLARLAPRLRPSLSDSIREYINGIKATGEMQNEAESEDVTTERRRETQDVSHWKTNQPLGTVMGGGGQEQWPHHRGEIILLFSKSVKPRNLPTSPVSNYITSPPHIKSTWPLCPQTLFIIYFDLWPLTTTI